MTGSSVQTQTVGEALRSEVGRVHRAFYLYMHLFAEDEDRFNLLAQTALPLLDDLIWILPDMVLLDLCRLADVQTTGTKKNFTLQTAADSALPHLSPTDQAKLEGLLQEFHQLCQPLRPWRDKRLAHRCDSMRTTNDLFAIANSTLGSVQRAVEVLIESAELILDAVDGGPGWSGFFRPRSTSGGALVWIARQAMTLRDLQDKEAELSEEELRNGLYGGPLKTVPLSEVE